MEKGHATGKYCFCDRKHNKGEKEPEPPTILWVVVAKLIFKAIMSYYFYEALFKVH